MTINRVASHFSTVFSKIEPDKETSQNFPKTKSNKVVDKTPGDQFPASGSPARTSNADSSQKRESTASRLAHMVDLRQFFKNGRDNNLTHHEEKSNRVNTPLLGELLKLRRRRGEPNKQVQFREKIKSLGINPTTPLRSLEKKGFVWKGSATQTLDIYRLESCAVLLWNKGPSKDKVFDIVDLDAVSGKKINVEQVLDRIDDRLRKIGSATTKAKRTKHIEELFLELYTSYYCKGESSLKTLRFADEKINELLFQQDKVGIKRWLGERAKELGLKNVDLEEVKVRKIIESLLYDADSVDLQNIGLFHGTLSIAIDSIINAGGLLPDLERRKAGLLKLSGELGRHGESWVEKGVMFYPNDGENVIGFGYFHGIECDVVFAMDKYKQKDFGIGERAFATIEDKISLADISKVFAPSFLIEDLQRAFDQHGYGHIHVLPLPKRSKGN